MSDKINCGRCGCEIETPWAPHNWGECVDKFTIGGHEMRLAARVCRPCMRAIMDATDRSELVRARTMLRAQTDAMIEVGNGRDAAELASELFDNLNRIRDEIDAMLTHHNASKGGAAPTPARREE